jgi:hypothetical protein
MYQQRENQNNASGTWQGIWSKLIEFFNEEMLAAQNSDYPFAHYLKAWRTLEILNKQIPLECRKDAETEYNKTIEIMNPTKIAGYDFYSKTKNKNNYLTAKAPEALLNLMAKYIESLYIHNWISKPDFTARPRNNENVHIGE